MNTCANCRFWKTYDEPGGGYCRRRSPSAEHGQPHTTPDYWCGEHEPVARGETTPEFRERIATMLEKPREPAPDLMRAAP